jgi:hypothetical protein
LFTERYLILVYITAGVTFVSTLIFFCIKITSCKPVSALWLPPFISGDMCMSESATDIMMNCHSVIGIIIDIGLVALPVWVIHTKMMFSRRKFRVLLIFTVGIFVIATGIVRFVLIRTTPFYIDATYAMTTIGIWTDLEGHVGLWCGCFPALQPILRAVLSSVGASRLLSSYKNSQYGQYGHNKPPTGGSRGWNRSSALQIPSQPLDSKHRSDDGSSQTGIVDGYEMESPTNSSGITKNTRVDVFYENRQSDADNKGTTGPWK